MAVLQCLFPTKIPAGVSRDFLPTVSFLDWCAPTEGGRFLSFQVGLALPRKFQIVSRSSFWCLLFVTPTATDGKNAQQLFKALPCSALFLCQQAKGPAFLLRDRSGNDVTTLSGDDSLPNCESSLSRLASVRRWSASHHSSRLILASKAPIDP